MRLVSPNLFISHECSRLKIEHAPISTSVYETYAQCNEDLIVESLIRAIFQQEKRDLSSLNYIEIGGNHPIQTSSTYLFYKIWGARGLIVEANNDLAVAFSQVRPNDHVINCAITDKHQEKISLYITNAHEISSVNADHADKFKSWGELSELNEHRIVQNFHINNFLEKYSKSKIDYLSIDIEGMDLPVLQAMNFSKFKPKILQCEHGNNIDSFNDVLIPNGYLLIGITDVNAIYVNINSKITFGNT